MFGGSYFGQIYPGGVPVAQVDSRANRGVGWENYVAPRTRKTLKQYKKEYLDLSYFEIKEEKERAKSEINLAEQGISVNVDLGVSDVIARLRAAIASAEIKLKALVWVEKERARKYKKAKLGIDTDLIFVASYLMDDDDD